MTLFTVVLEDKPKTSLHTKKGYSAAGSGVDSFTQPWRGEESPERNTSLLILNPVTSSLADSVCLSSLHTQSESRYACVILLDQIRMPATTFLEIVHIHGANVKSMFLLCFYIKHLKYFQKNDRLLIKLSKK